MHLHCSEIACMQGLPESMEAEAPFTAALAQYYSGTLKEDDERRNRTLKMIPSVWCQSIAFLLMVAFPAMQQTAWSMSGGSASHGLKRSQTFPEQEGPHHFAWPWCQFLYH
jgi:hypothetical protein